MSRITEMILDPQVTYTGKTFTVRVKVQDDYKYKKYLISENIKYVTATGESFTLTNVNGTQPGSILEITGKSIQNGTPTPDAPIEIHSVERNNDIFTSRKNIISNSDMTQAPGNNDNWVLGTLNSVTTSRWTSDGLTVTTPASGNQNNGRTIQLRNANDFIPAGTTVTFSIDITGTGTFGRIRGFYQGTGAAFYSNSVPIISDTSTTDPTTRRYTGTFIMPNIGTKNKDFYIALSQGNTAVTTRTYKNVQLEISQTATTYEKHQGERYQINLGGKNILQIINTQRTINGVTFTPQEDGSILVNGTATGGNATYPINRDSVNPGFSIPVEANTTYVISKSSPGNVDNILFQMYWVKDGTTTYSTAAFTTTAAAEIGAYIRVNNGNTVTNTKIFLQIEKRSRTYRIHPIRSEPNQAGRNRKLQKPNQKKHRKESIQIPIHRYNEDRERNHFHRQRRRINNHKRNSNCTVDFLYKIRTMEIRSK